MVSAPAGCGGPHLSTDSTDCDDTRTDVYGGAPVIPGDGFDNDCSAGGTGDECYRDDDGDGHGTGNLQNRAGGCVSGWVATNDDCDDTNSLRHPGQDETCDALDRDCDGDPIADAVDMQTWYYDSDGDGATGLVQQSACAAPSASWETTADGDCDDADASVYPNAIEACNTVDDDCDGLFDEGLQVSTWYVDSDNDGYGNPAVSVDSCAAPAGYVGNGDDCDDNKRLIHPGRNEVCNGKDDDCNNLIDDNATNDSIFYLDGDDDGFAPDGAAGLETCTPPPGYVEALGDCDDGDSALNPDAPEICDGIDNNCDGAIDDEDVDDLELPSPAPVQVYLDSDGDGAGTGALFGACTLGAGRVLVAGDCDDQDASRHPGAFELCNGEDEDCDSMVDESDSLDPNSVDPLGGSLFWPDVDGDLYGSGGPGELHCTAPSGYVAQSGDCDDALAYRNPSAPEVCDGEDNDCDGLVDDADGDLTGTVYFIDVDGDGYGSTAVSACDQGDYALIGEDCDDLRADRYPGALEVCDGEDRDCDGVITGATRYADLDGDNFGDPDAPVVDCEAPGVANALDCDDTSDRVFPHAPEVPDDGIDQDCDGVDEVTPVHTGDTGVEDTAVPPTPPVVVVPPPPDAGCGCDTPSAPSAPWWLLRRR
ncbi:MAG: putative metal-binding motif-containing protein [Alphaproteobacteria bacterium]|nr:putative metal-binding motif-containing protein [Alphaproteobacteria bacterium]